MKPAPFDYHAPENLAEATALLSRLDNAKVLAGGQSLVPMMNFRYVIADHIVDLAKVEGLSGITVAGGKLRIGAMTRQRELEFSPEIATHCPLMRAALGHVGHRQTRNRGTIGGSLAHADPAAELPAVCVAHDATIEVVGSSGARRLPIGDFGKGFMATALEPGEILVAIEVPVWPAGHGYGFHEFARRHGDFAIAGAAVLLEAQDGTVRRISLTLFGVTAAPVRIAAVETMLAGKRLDAALLRAAAAATAAIEPIADIHAGADYRRHLAHVLTLRALTDAAKRAGIAI
jgi:carbon-monoxide dehydrogenase medium subunit